MSTCVNGWPVLESNSDKLHRWVLGDENNVVITLRNGSAGLILAHLAKWFSEEIETLIQAQSGGYNKRPIGGTTTWSNHAGGVAEDLNWQMHPQHTYPIKTFSQHEIDRIHEKLKQYDGCVKWGGDWHVQYLDAMHFEISSDLSHCEVVAKSLFDTKRGKILLDLNPGQKAVVLS